MNLRVFKGEDGTLNIGLLCEESWAYRVLQWAKFVLTPFKTEVVGLLRDPIEFVA